MSQINIRFPENLRKAADKYVKQHKYKNIQQLTMQAVREKIDDEFSRKELDLIEKFAKLTIEKGELVEADEIFSRKRKS